MGIIRDEIPSEDDLPPSPPNPWEMSFQQAQRKLRVATELGMPAYAERSNLHLQTSQRIKQAAGRAKRASIFRPKPALRVASIPTLACSEQTDTDGSSEGTCADHADPGSTTSAGQSRCAAAGSFVGSQDKLCDTAAPTSPATPCTSAITSSTSRAFGPAVLDPVELNVAALNARPAHTHAATSHGARVPVQGVEPSSISFMPTVMAGAGGGLMAGAGSGLSLSSAAEGMNDNSHYMGFGNGGCFPPQSQLTTAAVASSLTTAAPPSGVAFTLPMPPLLLPMGFGHSGCFFPQLQPVAAAVSTAPGAPDTPPLNTAVYAPQVGGPHPGWQQQSCQDSPGVLPGSMPHRQLHERLHQQPLPARAVDQRLPAPQYQQQQQQQQDQHQQQQRHQQHQQQEQQRRQQQHQEQHQNQQWLQGAQQQQHSQHCHQEPQVVTTPHIEMLQHLLLRPPPAPYAMGPVRGSLTPSAKEFVPAAMHAAWQQQQSQQQTQQPQQQNQQNQQQQGQQQQQLQQQQHYGGQQRPHHLDMPPMPRELWMGPLAKATQKTGHLDMPVTQRQPMGGSRGPFPAAGEAQQLQHHHHQRYLQQPQPWLCLAQQQNPREQLSQYGRYGNPSAGGGWGNMGGSSGHWSDNTSPGGAKPLQAHGAHPGRGGGGAAVQQGSTARGSGHPWPRQGQQTGAAGTAGNYAAQAEAAHTGLPGVRCGPGGTQGAAPVVPQADASPAIIPRRGGRNKNKWKGRGGHTPPGPMSSAANEAAHLLGGAPAGVEQGAARVSMAAGPEA